MKKILPILFTLFFVFSTAQMDTEHWFAPFAASVGTNNQLQADSYLYVSTSETTPFSVEVYNNNTLFTTVQLSKGNPQVIDIPYSMMMTADRNLMFNPVQLGLHVKGSKKFFANFRFAVPNHAEILTSKGLAGVGKLFFAAMAPITIAKNYVNSNIGIIATEDNTSVTISGYDPAIVFYDGTSSATKSFILNKGESYILNALSSDAPANLDGLIGAKIEATQPIAVSNGNFNAIYTNENFTNNDVLMDQSVPVERLGNEFVLVKGNGPPNNNMESALVVATEDDTHIFVNGVDSGVFLDAGEFYVFNASYYMNQGNDHYNMNIATSKNAYVYQLLAGVSTGNPYATGGFNFIPPLSCFLPNKIDEISAINQIGNTSYNAKLNIITEKGATVSVNGTVLSGTQGPFPVTGNLQWETYNVLGVSGNITVNSTRSVTAGIASGDGAVGYGGYFAGFSSVPVISKTGDCYSGVLLQVDDSYDFYQWYLNGVLIPGETTYFINPEDYGDGDYTCIITKTNCDTKLTTPYQFVVCPPLSTTNFTLGTCKTLTITPAFTASTQNIDPSKTKIRVQGIYGTAVIDATTGIITYTPNTNLTINNTDFFVYYIEGNGTPPDSQFFKVVIDLKVLTVTNDILRVCPNTNGTGTFNLNLANISTDPTNTIKYYSDSSLTQLISNFTNFNTIPTTVFAEVTSIYGCSKTAQIQLELFDAPILNLNNYNSNFCDDLFVGSIPIKFSTVSPKIISNYNSSFIVRYYLTPGDQQTGSANFLPDDWSFSTDTTVYFRVENTSGCPVVFGQIDFQIGAKLPLNSLALSTDICDNQLTGTIAINLGDYQTLFTSDTSVTTTFYNSEADAKSKQNAISSAQSLTATKTFYYRFESSTSCPNIASLTLNFKSPKKSLVLENQEICPSDTTILDAGSGFDSYKWNMGETSQSITATVGTYYVDLGYNGCVYRQSVEVIGNELPIITNIEVTGNAATVFVSGGSPPYEYSLDNITFQTSNIFSNIPRGLHTVYVKDAQNCETVFKEFLIINLINVITPNDDGKNDVLDYSDLSIKKEVKIEIYDRFGNLVFLSQKPPYIWNGKNNGRVLSTGNYWYILSWIEPDTNLPAMYKGWILLKNRN